MADMNENLLPCPFCGGEAELISPTETDRWAQVNCKNCGGRGTEYPAETARAIAAWNKRALPPLRAREEIARYIANNSATAGWQAYRLTDDILAILASTAGQEWREPMKMALAVLCAARSGQSWSANMMKDFDAAIYGLRVALEIPAPPVAEPIVAEKSQL